MKWIQFGLIFLSGTVSFCAFAAEELVQTPGGLRPKSMVKEISPSEVIFDGEHPERTSHSSQLGSKAVNDSGWIASTFWMTPENNQLRNFETQWMVPDQPSIKGNQLLYVFNGLMPPNVSAILQPVLQWGVSPAGGGPYWAVASWYVKASGEAYHTPLVRVNSGQLLRGTMTLTEQNGNAFSYRSEFVGIPNTALSIRDIEELRTATETLEAYYVDDCAKYPTGITAFNAIGMTLSNWKPELSWGVSILPHSCGTNMQVVSNSAKSGEIVLHY